MEVLFILKLEGGGINILCILIIWLCNLLIFIFNWNCFLLDCFRRCVRWLFFFLYFCCLLFKIFSLLWSFIEIFFVICNLFLMFFIWVCVLVFLNWFCNKWSFFLYDWWLILICLFCCLVFFNLNCKMW